MEMQSIYRIRALAADPERILSNLWDENIKVIDAVNIDIVTVEFSVYADQLDQLQTVLMKQNLKFAIIERKGLLWKFCKLRNHALLLVGVLIYIIFVFFLPNRIYFLKVVGNETIPDNYILSAAQACGVGFGTKSSRIRSEEMKNMLLSQVPGLQWVGVTTSGSVATIHVKERSTEENEIEDIHMVSDIVASVDGIVTQVIALKGTPEVRPGQAVEKGDILISGYTDCERHVKAERAEGEVYAYSNRQIMAVSLEPSGCRENVLRKHTCINLQIGKKVINLCNHSGIQDATCVKMYMEDYWALPGNFYLPVCVIKEIYTFYEISWQIDDRQNFEWLSNSAREYVLSQMVVGQILDESLEWTQGHNYCALSGRYACHEMIGQVKHEELIEQYAEDN